MLEGDILRTGRVAAGANVDFGVDGLRPLRWSELVARLGAAHELRRAFREQGNADEGSFDRGSARQLETFGEGQPGINPFALANRRNGHSKGNEVSSELKSGDRGRS